MYLTAEEEAAIHGALPIEVARFHTLLLVLKIESKLKSGIGTEARHRRRT
jgi:hypothetical protein